MVTPYLANNRERGGFWPYVENALMNAESVQDEYSSAGSVLIGG
jgi:hypothetical protein